MVSVTNWILPLLVAVVALKAVGQFPEDGFLHSTCSTVAGSLKPCVESHSLQCLNTNGNFSCECKEGMVGGRDRTEPCLSMVGKPCQMEVESSAVVKCVRNAFCRNGTCDCHPSFDAADSMQLCLIGYGNQMPCGDIHDCNYNRGLECRAPGGQLTGGACVCPLTQIWEAKSNACRARVGSPCDDKHNKCVDNAECSATKKICTCGGDFRIVSDSRECKKNYGKSCSITGTEEHDCHTNFQCLTTGPDHKLTCACKPDVEWFHDVSGGHCDKIAGENCVADVTPCVPNSVCRFGKCTCSDGFEKDNKGLCVIGHMGDCSWYPDVCNARAKLICGKDSRRCECQPNFEYQEHLKMCQGLPGVPCEVPTDCYPLAECSLTSKKCECIPGYTSNSSDGRCQLMHDQQCSIKKPCNAFDFLHCDYVTQRCVCAKSEMYYDPDRKTCQSKVGDLCFLNPVDGRTLNCVRNGECVKNSDSASVEHGKCGCNKGFEATDKGFCDPSRGSGSRIGGTFAFNILALISVAALKILSDSL